MDNGDNTPPKLSTLTNKDGQIKLLKFCLDYEEYDIPLTDFIIFSSISSFCYLHILCNFPDLDQLLRH